MKVMRKKWCVLGESGQNLDCEYELKEEMWGQDVGRGETSRLCVLERLKFEKHS